MLTMGRTPKKRKTAFGKRLVFIRQRLGLNIAQAAARVKVSKSAWSAWETGERTPDAGHNLLIDMLENDQLP